MLLFIRKIIFMKKIKMNIILSILVASTFTLFWLLKFQWFFDFWKVNLINIDWTFDADFSNITNIINYIFYIPDILFNLGKDTIKNFFSKYLSLNNTEIYLWLMFIYHIILSLIIELFARMFWWYKHKKYIVLLMIWLYLWIIYTVKIFMN